jgi:SAM-dependent methyltransferase
MIEIRQLWDNAADGWDKKIATKGTLRSILLEQGMSQLLKDLKRKRILDAGCGNGYFTGWLNKKGSIAQGIDFSETMINKARLLNPSCEFKCFDLNQRLEYENGFFDGIVANMLLMHLKEPGSFIKEAGRILKPKGWLLASILHPCFNTPATVLYKSLWGKLTNKRPNGLIKDYFMNKNESRMETGINTELTHYHRTLSEYSVLLSGHGFLIEQIFEPHELPESFLAENPKLEYATRLPRILFIKAVSA